MAQGHVFALHFVSVPWAVVWFSDPTGSLFQACLHEKWEHPTWRLSSWFQSTSFLLPLRHSFFRCPNQIFQPGKNENNGPRKKTKSQGTRTHRTFNSQNAAKIGLLLSGTAKKKTRPRTYRTQNVLFEAFFEGRKKEHKPPRKSTGLRWIQRGMHSKWLSRNEKRLSGRVHNHRLGFQQILELSTTENLVPIGTITEKPSGPTSPQGQLCGSIAHWGGKNHGRVR